jgi:phosphate transport system protein
MMLDKEMSYLNEMIVKMSTAVQYNIRQAVDLYYKRVDKIDINDDLVNQYESMINEICIDTLVRERPYAKDLRELSAVLKLVSDLERIGDHAIDLQTWGTKLLTIPDKRSEEIDNMLNKTLQMVDDSIKSFVYMDYDLAHNVVKTDDEIDKMYDENIENLAHYDIKNQDSECFVVYTTLVVKYIERIADHATNIAEWVCYIIKGTTKDDL